MRYLILVFILLLLSIWLGLEMSRGAGYVLIAYRHWTIETSLWVAIISLLIIFIVFYIVFRTLGRTARISKNLKRWRKMRHHRKGRQLTHIGLCELAEGNWQSAEQTLIKASKLARNPLINFLAAAQAANAEHAYERRDNYLRRAHSSARGSKIAVDLTQAQLQMESKQWEQALATLQHVKNNDPHQRHALNLLKTVYTELGDWESLRDLLPALRKNKIESPEALDGLEQTVYLFLLERACLKGTQALMETWRKFPRSFHHDPILIRKYTRYLVERHEDDEAVALIESVLKKQWDSVLVKTFSVAKGESVAKQLTVAEHWLKKYPKEPELLLCLGRLSVQEKFWGKAREYLQASLQLAPSTEAYQELGKVYLALGDKEAALECFQKGIQLSV